MNKMYLLNIKVTFRVSCMLFFSKFTTASNKDVILPDCISNL